MNLNSRNEIEIIVPIVRDQDQLLFNDPLENDCVGLARPATVRDMVRLKSSIVRYSNIQRGEALIDQESHSA